MDIRLLSALQQCSTDSRARMWPRLGTRGQGTNMKQIIQRYGLPQPACSEGCLPGWRQSDACRDPPHPGVVQLRGLQWHMLLNSGGLPGHLRSYCRASKSSAQTPLLGPHPAMCPHRKRLLLTEMLVSLLRMTWRRWGGRMGGDLKRSSGRYTYISWP